ncbi:MAG: hypothetical protein WDO73_01770 [Ignavibacteriota bacterium]
MAENEAAQTGSPEAGASGPARTTNEVALELMKFIAVNTGYGKTPGSGTGFSGKPSSRSAEEHAEALLELFERCRKVVKKES